jgi:hypothetical protein
MDKWIKMYTIFVNHVEKLCILAIFSTLSRVEKSSSKNEQSLPDNFFMLSLLFF